MKFSCPNCSAKYQIADDKVAGRTVKMKCRKCGTTIPIRAPTAHSIAAAPMVRAQSLAPSVRGRSAPAPAPAVAPPPPTEIEWHAGINGQALGPMTRRELERRVREGSVNKETFVWHEGMSGWKQIPEVPELEGLLEQDAGMIAPPPPSMPAQAKAQALRPLPRPSLGPRPGGAAIPSPKGPAPSRPSALKPSRPTPAVGMAAVTALKSPTPAVATPAPAAAAPAPSPVTPAAAAKPAARASGAVKGGAVAGDDWDDVLGDVGGSGASGAAPPKQEAPIPDIAMPGEGPYVSSSIKPSYDSVMLQLRKKRANPYVVPFAVAAALILGITVGFVLFGDQETKIVRQIVEVPTKVRDAIDDKQAVKELGEEEDDSGDSGEEVAVAPSGAKSAGSGKVASNGDTKPAEVKGLQGLSGLQGLDGPSGGPTGPSSSSAGTQELSSGQIQTTVSKYQNSVKRGCWERALMTREKDAPSSARVSVAIKVAPGGNVTSATTTGDPKGYSGLASCIAMRVRGWQFPRSSGATTVNVPFVFAAQ